MAGSPVGKTLSKSDLAANRVISVDGHMEGASFLEPQRLNSRKKACNAMKGRTGSLLVNAAGDKQRQL